MKVFDPQKDIFYRDQFKTTQVGCIIKVVRPINKQNTITEISNIFEQNPQLDSLPVSDDSENVFGLLYKDKLPKMQSSNFWGSIFPDSKTILDFVDIECAFVDSRDYIEIALNEIIKCTKQDSFLRDFIIISHNKYIGVGKVVDLIMQINRVREFSLSSSKKVQSFFMSKSDKVKIPFDTYTYTSFSAELGGDFYKYMQINPDVFLISIFDVSGKDISASLFTACLSAFFSTINFVLKDTLSEQNIIDNLNSVCYDQTNAWMFITGILLFINVKTKTLSYYNFGHPPAIFLLPYISKALKFSKVNLPPLGAVKKQRSFEFVKKVKLGKCHRIFLYTDGLSEAQNIDGVLFGVKKVENILLENLKKDSRELFENIKENLNAFVKEKIFSDDVTMILIDFDKILK